MKKIALILVASAVGIGVVAAGATDVHAASATSSSYGKRCAGHTSGVTRGGYVMVLSNYRAYGRMNCASVRYAAKHLRKRMQRTRYGSPNVSFHDGYVRWRCGAFDNGGIDCDEYTSYTSFEVKARWL